MCRLATPAVAALAVKASAVRKQAVRNPQSHGHTQQAVEQDEFSHSTFVSLLARSRRCLPSGWALPDPDVTKAWQTSDLPGSPRRDSPPKRSFGRVLALIKRNEAPSIAFGLHAGPLDCIERAHPICQGAS